MFARYAQRRVMPAFFPLCAVLFLGLALASGCGDKEEEAAPAESTAPQTQAQAEEVASEGIEAAAAVAPTDAPAVLLPLSWVSDEAQIAVGIPSFNGFLDRALALARRVLPDPAMADGMQAQALEQFAMLLGLEQAESFGSAAATRGIDLDNPAVLFADFSTGMKVAVKAAATAEAGEAPALDMEALLTDLSLLLLFSVTNADLAKASADDLLVKAHSGIEVERIEETVGALTLALYPAIGTGFFVHNGFLCVGDTALLKSAAKNSAAPMEMRYGSADCPAGGPEEIVTLVFADRLMPLYREMGAMLPENTPEEVKRSFDIQIQMMERMFGTGESSDPVIGTLNLDDEKLEIASRVDTKTHPGMLETVGEPAPLNFLAFQPENSLAMLGLRFNEAAKKMFREQYISTIQSSGTNALATAGMAVMVGSVLDALGEELMLSVSASEGPLPAVLGLLDLANPEAAKLLLAGFTQPGGESHRDIQVNMIPFLFPILTAIVQDTLIVSMDEAVLHKTIDLALDGGTTAYAAQLEPPLDASAPRYSLLVVDPAAVSQALTAWMPEGGLPPEYQRLSSVIAQVRASAEMDGTWMSNRFTVHLKP